MFIGDDDDDDDDVCVCVRVCVRVYVCGGSIMAMRGEGRLNFRRKDEMFRGNFFVDASTLKVTCYCMMFGLDSSMHTAC